MPSTSRATALMPTPSLDVEPLEFFASVAALSIEKALLHREVLAKERIEQQLRIARAVQAGLLPDAPPQLPGYDVAASTCPATRSAATTTTTSRKRGGQIGIAIADVSGKGVPAALIMATFRAALRGELRRRRDVRDALVDVGRTLMESQTGRAFRDRGLRSARTPRRPVRVRELRPQPAAAASGRGRLRNPRRGRSRPGDPP